MDRAEQMRGAAAKVVEVLDEACTDAHVKSWAKDRAAAIRAIPLPPQPPLDADVAGMVEMLRDALGVSPETGKRAADLIERLASEKAEAERRVKWVEAEINSCMDANFRQAMCITYTASALGPEISATIDGLPKAARHVRTRAEQAEAEVAQLREAQPAPTLAEAAKVLLNCHTVQTMIAAGKRLDLEEVLRSIAEGRE